MPDDSSVRIVTGLRALVARQAPGSRLPSSRELVAHYGASPVTVQRALRALAHEGVLESRPGVGTFVRAVPAVRPADYGWQTAALGTPATRLPAVAGALRVGGNELIALHSGYPAPELLPERLVRAAITRAARGDAALVRPPAAGLPELQAWFAGELATGMAAGVAPPVASDVVILPGSQSALSSIFRALVPPGRPLLVESPTYWGALLAAAQAGVRVVPVPSGPGGPDPQALARAFAETGARCLYAQPTDANPTGARWSPAVVRDVLGVVRAAAAFMVEDDWARDLGADGAPPVATLDDAGHVLYLRSLTKSVSPALRVAALVARGPARERVLADRTAGSLYVSGLLQAAALDVVTQPAWRSHLRRLHAALRERRDLLLASLATHAPEVRVEQVPAGGLNVWARLPDAVDGALLARDCEHAGLLVADGAEWFPAEPPGVFVRLGFAGPNPGAYPQAARILGEQVRRQLI